MILSKEVPIRLNYKNKENFKNFGYDVNDAIINVKVEHLFKGSHVKVKIKCDICGIEKEQFYFAYNDFISRNEDNKYYCGKCNQINRKHTNIEKYGEDSPIKVQDIKNRRNKTIIDKYGTDHPCKNEDVKNKIIITNLERYGVKYPLLGKEIKNKIIENNIKNYGTEQILSNKKFREKCENIMVEKYGDKYSFNIYRKDNIEKSYNTKTNKIKNDYSNIVDIIGTEYIVQCDCGEEHQFTINSHNFYQRIKYKTTICTICNPIDKHISGLEIEFVNFIKRVYDGEITLNDRNVISPMEIDIYLPELRIGFEFNGLYWHSDKYKDIEYHKNKINISNNKDIRLFHVYDDDWKYKKDIIMSDIKNLINPKLDKIDSIIEINNNVSEFYNNQNNLYEHLKSNINIIGVKDDNIVSMMNFKKNKNFYEIVRLTGNDNFDILFDYFKNKYKPNTINGFVYKDWNIYNFYERNNFIMEKETEPNFHYIIENKRRKNIEELLFEKQIPKIYDSGKIFYKLEIRDK